MKVAVITPTIGTQYLKRNLESVSKQTYKNLTHYIFIDGKDCQSNVQAQISKHDNVKSIILEENVGKGWYGHRVYAACSFLVNADVICYLDEDNWYDENHVQNVVDKLEKGYDWVYSLRKIYDQDANFLLEDNCESLGNWPVYFNDSVFHIDTSCFAVKRNVAVAIGHSWYGQWGADRQFFQAMKKHFNNFACTGEYSCNYRLDGNENSVTKDFFENGNKSMEQKYGGTFPWRKENHNKETTGLKVETIGPGIRIIV